MVIGKVNIELHPIVMVYLFLQNYDFFAFFSNFFTGTLQYIPVFSETLGNTLTLLLFTCNSILIMIFTIFFTFC